MTHLRTALEIAELSVIKSLDLSMFGRDDLLNVVLQRSEILADQPNPAGVIKAWQDGDCGPADRVIDQLGTDLVRRALAIVLLEYLELKPLLQRINPQVVADIGCGYGFFDFFLQQDFGAHVVLIDLEDNPHRHFQYRDVAAAYSSLATTRRFFVRNGGAENTITTLNPEFQDVQKLQGVDLAVSFLSCGFHYPWTTYQGFFADTVIPGGHVILDIRKRRAASALEDFSFYGEARQIGSIARGKAKRIWLHKPAETLAKAS